MNYSAALVAGKVTLILILTASLYYFLRTLFVFCMAHGMAADTAKLLRPLVTYARISHPYVAALIPFSALYHIYAMWLTHALGVKTGLGIAAASMLAGMIVLGTMLKIQPANIRIRLVHRTGAMLLIGVALAHRLA